MNKILSFFMLLFITLSGIHASSTETSKVIFLGDSITKAKRVEHQKSFLGLLEKKLKEDNIAVEFINSGVGGNKITDGAQRLQKCVIDLKPNIAVVMFGCNDSFIDRGKTVPRISLEKFKKNLDYIVTEFKKNHITIILMTTTPIDPKKVDYYPYNFHGSNFYLKPYMQAVRDKALKENIALVDHFKDWEKYCSSGGNTGDLLYDFVHPNPDGYQRMSKAIYPVLKSVISEKKISNPTFEKKISNLAFEKKCFSSSKNPHPKWSTGLTDGRKTAKEGADKRTGGYASGNDSNFPKTTTIDLEKNSDISKIIVYNMKRYGTKNIEVSISVDGKNFKNIGKHTFEKSDGATKNFTFPKQQARYVQIKFLDTYIKKHNFVFLREVEVL
jgi:lysophospholipase L1-like esterase